MSQAVETGKNSVLLMQFLTLNFKVFLLLYQRFTFFWSLKA